MVRRIVMGLAVSAALGACGGGQKAGTVPDEGGGEVAPDDDDSDGMVPPERMDQIRRDLDRKRQSATRCLTQAIDAGDADKATRGKITLGFVIAASGRPRDVAVVQATLQSRVVQDCVVDLVQKMEFGALPRDLEWSYTFAFEAF